MRQNNKNTPQVQVNTVMAIQKKKKIQKVTLVLKKTVAVHLRDKWF